MMKRVTQSDRDWKVARGRVDFLEMAVILAVALSVAVAVFAIRDYGISWRSAIPLVVSVAAIVFLILSVGEQAMDRTNRPRECAKQPVARCFRATLRVVFALMVAWCLALVAVVADSVFQGNQPVVSQQAITTLSKDVTKANHTHETQIVGYFIGSTLNHRAGAWLVYLQIRTCAGRSLVMPTSFVPRKKADQANRFSAILSRFDQMECVDSTSMAPARTTGSQPDWVQAEGKNEYNGPL